MSIVSYNIIANPWFSFLQEEEKTIDQEAEEMEAFEDDATGLVKNLLRSQVGVVPIPGSTEHFDIFLANNVYPCLVPGLEELSREIDRLMNSEEAEIDISIKNRFNPCIFLAEYLMRNNPRHGNKLEYTELFLKQSRVEKIRRFFHMKKQKIYKHFCIQPYQANFQKKNVQTYVNSLDSYLQMSGKLTKNFKFDTFFSELSDTDNIQFEDFYDILCKWAISAEQTTLDYADFAAADEKAAPK